MRTYSNQRKIRIESIMIDGERGQGENIPITEEDRLFEIFYHINSAALFWLIDLKR